MQTNISKCFPTKEMVEFFLQRTEKHIELVRKNMNFLKQYGISNLNLTEHDISRRATHHDESKYSDIEFIPFVWLTEYYRCKRNGLTLYYPTELVPLIKNATQMHVTTNLHHPEAHNNISDMSNLDILEAVCDWSAMAEEFEEGSARKWAETNIGKKWFFSIEQSNLLYELITKLENNEKKGY